jgi:hypothetical protein
LKPMRKEEESPKRSIEVDGESGGKASDEEMLMYINEITAGENPQEYDGRGWRENKGNVRWDAGEKWMDRELEKYGRNVRHHVTEIYSSPRVDKLATRTRMVPGMSLDLAVDDPDDGKPWDFNNLAT